MRTSQKAAAAAIAAAALTLVGAGTAQAAPARPDLVVTAVTWAPGAVAKGQSVTFAATVENRGTKATTAGVVLGVGFQVDGTLVSWSDGDTASLAPGESVTLTANSGPSGTAAWSATKGKHEILAFVDDAGRITESDESNNRTKKTMNVSYNPGVVRSTTMNGAVPSSTVRSWPKATGLATYVSGSVYAACMVQDANGVATAQPGTEIYLGEYSAGNSTWHQDAPFGGSGVADVPAGATTVTSSPVEVGEIARYNYGAPEEHLICTDGAYAGFTRLHVTSVTTNRYAVASNGYNAGALLGTFTGPANVDLMFG